MVYTKTEKPEKIPIGDGYIPDVSEAELEEMVAAIPNCKELHGAAHTDGYPQKEEM